MSAEIKMKYIGYLTVDEIVKITGKSINDFHFIEGGRGDYVVLPCDDEYIHNCEYTLAIIESAFKNKSRTLQSYYRRQTMRIENDLALIEYIRKNFNITTNILVYMEG